MPQNNRDVKSQDYIGKLLRLFFTRTNLLISRRIYFLADISFERKVRPVSVNIYETYHPGSVVRIWASDGFEKWKLLWEGSPQVRDHMPYIFSPAIKKINFYTKYFFFNIKKKMIL